MYQLKQHNVLVTVGVSILVIVTIISHASLPFQEDEQTINPQIKVWDWDKVKHLVVGLS